MKKVFKSILVTVAAALAFASCQREGDVNGTEGRTVRFLAGPVETRTAFSTPDATGQYPVLWTENDTKVKVSLNMASGVDATVTPNGATAWRASNGLQSFKVVTDVAGTHLYGNMSKGTMMIFR